MKKLSVLLFVLLLAGCTPDEEAKLSNTIKLNTNNPAFKAAQYMNFEERTHRTELREFTGVDPVRTEWCAAFVNAVLEESNIPSNKNHKYPLTARAFLDWGEKIHKDQIQAGDIVVFPRGTGGWQGHVGFYLRTQIVNGREYYWILGGNQRNKVSIVLYRSNKSLGIRRQKENNG